MAARKTRGRLGSWQTKRLLAFADYEISECKLYEMFYEKTAHAIPFKILSVMVFLMKEQYWNKPGSLITLYRASKGSETPLIDFFERYERYYSILVKEGYL